MRVFTHPLTQDLGTGKIKGATKAFGKRRASCIPWYWRVFAGVIPRHDQAVQRNYTEQSSVTIRQNHMAPLHKPDKPMSEQNETSAAIGKPAKIIVAEDEEHIGYMVRFRLEKAGYEVVWKMDGTTAWEAVLEEMPDMVLLDVMLPGMDGYQILEKIKESTDTRHIPVVLLSALGQESNIVRAFRAGAEDYIVKPFKPAELMARIARVCPPLLPM